MVAQDDLAEVRRQREIAALGRAAIERQRGFGDRQRIAKMRVVLGGAAVTQAAVGRAAMREGPVERALGGFEQRGFACDIVQGCEAGDRPAVLARIAVAVDRRLRAGAALSVAAGVEGIAMQRRSGIGILAGIEAALRRAHEIHQPADDLARRGEVGRIAADLPGQHIAAQGVALDVQ